MANSARILIKRLLIGIVIGLCFAACLSDANSNANENHQAGAGKLGSQVERPQLAGGDSIKSKVFSNLPRLLRFEQFKQFFNKSYASLVEELRRKKLFLARAFRAFASRVGYNNKQKNSYLAVNHLSDRTQSELQGTLMKSEAFESADEEEFFDAKSDFEADAHAQKQHNDDEDNDIFYDAKSNFQADADEEEEKFYDARSEFPTAKRKRRSVDNQSGGYFNHLPGAGYLKSLYQKAPSSEYLANSVRSVYGKASNMFAARQSDRAEVKTSLQADLLPDEVFVDHRKSGCFVEPQQQGEKCAAGYLFAATALYEYMNCLNSGQLVALSNQFPLDCGAGKACAGGHAKDLADFVQQHGFELDKSYPYLGKKEHCPYNVRRAPNFMGFYKAVNTNVSRILPDKIELMHKITPIFIPMSVNELFFEYGGGVDDAIDCDKSQDKKHAVLLVGSGREDGHEYWLIRNSYSVFWGEQGYYKLNKRANCFKSSHIYVPSAPPASKQVLEENKEYDSKPVDFRYTGFIEDDVEGETGTSALD